MKGVLTSVSYRNVGNESAEVYIFVRCEDKVRRQYKFKAYPYLYSTDKHVRELVKHIGPNLLDRITGIDVFPESEKDNRFQDYIDNKHLGRICIKQPKDCPPIRDALHGKGISTWEADIPYVNRFLIDSGLKLAINIDDDGHITPIDNFYIKPRYWVIDIEALVENEEQKINVESPEPIINIGIYDSYDKRYYLLYIGEGEILTDKNAQYIPFVTEKLMLSYFYDLIQRKDPDIIMGFNIKDYDLPKIMHRSRSCGLDPRKMSPINGASTGKKRKFKIQGRDIIDVYEISRFLMGKELQSHSLDYVNRILGHGTGKLELYTSYKKVWETDQFKLLRYNKRDVDCVIEIELEQDLIRYLDEIRRLTGVTYEDIVYKTTVYDIYIMRKLAGKYILPTKKKGVEGAGYLGAYVEEPIPGVYHNVLVIDFDQLYPNVFMTFNLGYETLIDTVTENQPVSFLSKAQSDIVLPGITNIKQRIIERFDDNGKAIYAKNKKGKIKEETVQKNITYYLTSGRKSIIVEILDELINRRLETKKKIREAKTQSDIDIYTKQDAAFKSIVNSAYGVMGMPGFRLFKPGVGEACCNAARQALMFAIDKVREMGYRVIYGDTDSVFISLGEDFDGDPVVVGKMISDNINTALIETFGKMYGNLNTNTIRTDMETVYQSLAIWGKKNYLGKVLWNKGQYRTDYKWRGMAAIRSDSSQLIREIQETLGKSIVDGKLESYRLEYLDRLKDKLFNRDITLYEMGSPKQLRKALREYDVAQPHVKGARYSNIHFGTFYKRGDKPMWVYIVSPSQYPPTDCISYTRDTHVPDGFEVDLVKSVDKLIQPVIDRFLDLVDETYKIPLKSLNQSPKGRMDFYIGDNS